ncbi:MAG TPA: hypothetical protein ENF81_06460 [Thermotogaceae bacterium]|nr:hypothetical protein [Thermotogaceae bacterium]
MTKIKKGKTTAKKVQKSAVKNRETITRVNASIEKALQVDIFNALNKDEKIYDIEIPEEQEEYSDENNDEFDSENAFAEALSIKPEDLGLELEERPKASPVNRIRLRVVKGPDGFVCLNSGMRAFVNKKNLKKRYQMRLDIYEATERIKWFVQSYLNGFFEFEEVKPEVLEGVTTSIQLGIKYRSLLTKNYIKFWNAEIWALNVMTGSGRPNKGKQAMALVRLAMGADQTLKETAREIAKHSITADGTLKKTMRVERFLSETLKIVKKHLIGIEVSSKELQNMLNDSKEFRALILKLRGDKND